ncbi:hypothetical protein Q5H92_13090 [Hymenobacter sp. M29]|uniref:MoxR-vWA-beta-propeller ternary system domain-containing protein n=1 Tax=Hymenobacter mellowenesis TaxID=3063995 RepID=A0ABT9ABS9_9BACT|nr:hypothetical protein [Hymenobacter sp. M29]MDO7847301.1 hypothetical protein [Hymenobacter sp. M29]
MLLTAFLHDILTTGAVTLAGQPSPFEPTDLHAAEASLRAYHAEDALELPQVAPAFDAPAALWATQFLYHTVQLALLRELDERVIGQCLKDFAGEITPEAIYSADLTFRYLPDLLRLAKGLAPGDALVTRLLAVAQQWPLSFVGTALDATEAEAEAVVLAHPALRPAYIDRIIQMKDRARAGQPHLAPLVQAALGGHAATLWPDFAAFTILA